MESFDTLHETETDMNLEVNVLSDNDGGNGDEGNNDDNNEELVNEYKAEGDEVYDDNENDDYEDEYDNDNEDEDNEDDDENNFNEDEDEFDGDLDVSSAVNITHPDSEDLSEKLLRLPVNRIKKLMKIDPDVSLASKEAVFLITKATELLINSLAKEAYTYTVEENKKTVMRKHLDAAISNIDALAFLEGTLD
ncbi:DNA polymerase epsilon subunit, putative [Pediculus humanus corporis]|uniref:DNA polymerase epsilon subunit, putative n=1 Tax=Pediculus humanus subsp. corporis TaxID=121224 RepID=E0VDI9_PEDHC|nr:DNA polymerase epsilon subunit, putative [Pediculus humanus corporis]EEB11445.1 DNA polymerase epsilon subunit, putative [Pediculus humanus corporis]